MQLGPCAGLALLVHPAGNFHWFNRVMWAFAVYVESVSILPQLKMMMNMKVITELFAAHYVFALGCARGLSFMHWVFEFLASGTAVYVSMGKGLWPICVILSELTECFGRRKSNSGMGWNVTQLTKIATLK